MEEKAMVMNQAKNKIRDNKIDCMKGILIFFVVFGHSIQYGSGANFFSEECYFKDALFKIIYSFHMPCFGILSGYLYYQYVRSRTFVKKLKKIWKLLMPMLGFAALNAVISLYNGEILATLPAILKNYIWVVRYNWWFIWCIIICYMFWGVLESFTIKEGMKLALALCVQTLFIILPNRANSPLYGFIFLYFLIGYYIKNILRLYEKIKEKWRRILKCIIVILWIMCITFYRNEHYIYTSLLSINNGYGMEQLGIDIFRWLTGIFGSFTFLLVSDLCFQKIPCNKLLSFMGRNTIYIYILQGYFTMWLLKIINLDRVRFHYFFNFLEAISIAAINCVLIYTFGKMKQRMKNNLERRK